MDSQILLLVSKGFSSSVSSHWMDLREETHFYDVSLACQGSIVKAHRVILSACSPVLKELILQTQHPHPVLYLRGVNTSQINALLDFIYKGEVSVAREEVNDFLDVAKELKIKGLTLSEDNKQANGIGNGKRETVYFDPKIETSKQFESQIKDDPLNFENEDISNDIKLKAPRQFDNAKDDNQIKTNPSYNEQISENINYSPEAKEIFFDPNLQLKNYKSQIKIDPQCYENENVFNDKKFTDYKICQFCDDKVNKEGNNYRNHLREVHGHVKVNKLCCSKCFEVKEDYKALNACLQKHKTESFPEYPSEFKCNDNDCVDVTYNIKKSFLFHKRKHHGMDFALRKVKHEKLSCTFCKKLFLHKRNLEIHEKIRCFAKRKTVINQTDQTVEYKTCQFCNERVSKNGNNYKNHLEVVHGHVNVQKNLCCPNCFEVKADYKALRACISKHKIENNIEIPSEFKCKDCVDVIYDGNDAGRKSFLQHLRRYHGMKFTTKGMLPEEFSCKFCARLFATERSMSLHEEKSCTKNPANSHIDPKSRYRRHEKKNTFY